MAFIAPRVGYRIRDTFMLLIPIWGLLILLEAAVETRLLVTPLLGAGTGRHRILVRIRWGYVESNHRPHPYQGCALTG